MAVFQPPAELTRPSIRRETPSPARPASMASGCGWLPTAVRSSASTRPASRRGERRPLSQGTGRRRRGRRGVEIRHDQGASNVWPHNIARCSSPPPATPSSWSRPTASTAPSTSPPRCTELLAIDKKTGKVLWTDNSPGEEHPARPVVVPGLRRAGRRAAGHLPRRRRLAVQLRPAATNGKRSCSGSSTATRRNRKYELGRRRRATTSSARR